VSLGFQLPGFFHERVSLIAVGKVTGFCFNFLYALPPFLLGRGLGHLQHSLCPEGRVDPKNAVLTRALAGGFHSNHVAGTIAPGQLWIRLRVERAGMPD
jgi:hypothetical protein